MAKDLTEALQALTEQAAGQTSRVDRTLPTARVPPAIPARSGSSGPIAAAVSSIASPLTETSFGARQFYAAGWKSSDGLFTLPAIKKLDMVDANGSQVVFNFAEPA